MQVSAEGGDPQPLTRLDPEIGERDHRWPQFLPGGGSVLYSSRSVEIVEMGSDMIFPVCRIARRLSQGVGEAASPSAA